MNRAILYSALASALVTAAWALPLLETDRYGETFVTYAQVDRPDGTFRRMLTTPETLAALDADAPLPDGTRILMESYYSPDQVGRVFHMHRIDGQWRFGSFAGDGPVDLSTSRLATCTGCHAGASETDYVFTRSALVAAREIGLSNISCNRRGRRPCNPETYLVGPDH